jgi:succinate dehydrogenase/fumarate reductase-like Fe-S protein
MSFGRRTAAWLNLAWRFGAHVLVRMPQRVVRRSPDMQRFMAAVAPEGYTPLTADDRALVPAAMRCINCGLCGFGCDTLRATPSSAWDESWTFVAGPSRSIDRADLVMQGDTRCAADASAESLCPAGVPITRLHTLVNRMRMPRDIPHVTESQ